MFVFRSCCNIHLIKLLKSWGRYLMMISIAVIIIFTYVLKMETVPLYQTEQVFSTGIQEVAYLINTSNCRIPDDNPFNSDIIGYFKKEKSYSCSKYGLLTYIEKNNGVVTLNVNKSLLKAYSIYPVKCCYSNITRVNYETKIDNDIKLTDCVYFEDSTVISFPFLRVNCYTLLGTIYKNVHATTFPLPNRTTSTSKNPKFSVLLVGIDSMSKSNLIRTMPKTHYYAEKSFTNLKGYNKVGDNTFPNLMPLLTGFSFEQLEDFCNYSVKLNKCRFIWDKFKEAGYVTAYAEDECWINTFNYDRPGFLAEPTDYYYHPYFLASEEFRSKRRHSMTYCAGPETSGERLFNAAKDFAVTFWGTPSFGLFWANSFSHDDINMPAVMDEPLQKFLSDPEMIHALDNTILIFFSDHGYRFGEIRYTHSGWLEERLPFFYIHIPKTFQKMFPRKYVNFLTNSERLTVPYDIYNTMQDILQIGNDTYKSKFSKGCPKSSSLFSEVPENRTCEEACINQHWCTCKGHTYINSKSPLVREVAQFVVSQTNNLIESLTNGHLCSTYYLNNIRSAGMSEPYTNQLNRTVNYYLVIVETKPPAIFEATVEAYPNNEIKEFTLLGDISRIDRYGPVTGCIKGGRVKKYCYCMGFFEYLKSFIN